MIEIRELVIRATVDDSSSQNTEDEGSEIRRNDEVVNEQDYIERILEIIKEKRER